jgi:hypothetical protein
MVDSKSERSRGENIHVAAETFMYLVQFSIFGTPSGKCYFTGRT